MILDKAPETVKIFETEWVADGYGGGQNPVPSTRFKSYKAFILPTGFAGAGWAINMRYAGQGWADTARMELILKWRKELDAVAQWDQVEAQGRIWTIVQDPRHWRTRRVNYVSILCELKGDAQ